MLVGLSSREGSVECEGATRPREDGTACVESAVAAVGRTQRIQPGDELQLQSAVWDVVGSA